MRDKNAPPASGKPRKGAKPERLAAALRANLARRKAQKRLRDPGAGGKQPG